MCIGRVLIINPNSLPKHLLLVVLGNGQRPSKWNGVQNLDKSKVVVVMVPLPAQGHLNQLLHLSRIISAHGIPVHYVGTATHTRQAKLRAHGWDPLSHLNIHFHDYAVSSFDNPPPNPHAPTKYPYQLTPLFNATFQLREPVCALLRELSCVARKVIVIHDSLMFWVVQDVPSIPNCVSYCFHSFSAFTGTNGTHFGGRVVNFDNSGQKFNLARASKMFETALPTFIDEKPIEDLPTVESICPPEILAFSEVQNQARRCNAGNLFNTSRAIEDKHLKLLAEEKITETESQWAIGPFNPVEIKTEKKNHKCLEWLDLQPPNSVILVSFGTMTTSFTNEEIEEIAIGLQKSGQRYIWVLREADRGDNCTRENHVRRAPLPKGYEERIQERGFIVRDWAPQLEILRRSSTGGFMSHCGWNSCIESISMGVPIAAWPMHSDQPLNAILIARELKTGFMVREWKNRYDIVKSETVEGAVKRLMDSAEGDEMRRRAKELSNSVKQSVLGVGAIRSELLNFISHITR